MTTTAPTYNPSAEVYERELVPALFGPWAQRLLDLAALRAGDRVLDVACGTGIVARTAAARGAADVVGCDLNPAMLAVATRESDGLPLRWAEGDATSLPYPDGAFDLVVCQQALQFFAEREEALRHMRRVTSADGRVAVSVWRGSEHHPIFARFDEVLADHLPADVLEGSHAPFCLGDLDEVRRLFDAASFSSARLRVVSADVRFDSAEHFLNAIVGAVAPIAAALAAIADDEHADLIGDLTEALRPFTDDDGLVYPMVSSIVVARP